MRTRVAFVLVPALLIVTGLGIRAVDAAEITDDFSSASPAWQFVSEGVDVYAGITGGKLEMDFDTPLVGTYPAAGVAGAIYANPAFMPDTVDMRAVLEFEGDTGHVYAGLLARGDANLGYNGSTGEITGQAYNMVISGWADNGDIQLNRIGNGVQERLGIVSFSGLGDLIDNNPIYMKLTVETVGTGNVELKGVVSINSNYSDPFGEIEFVDDSPYKITGSGMIGLFGTNDQTYMCNPVNVKYDDLYAADFIDTSIEGDCNGDGYVNSADLDIVRGNWGQSVSGEINGDLSGDGVVNSSDLDLVRGNWGASAYASVVPEPTALCLLLSVVGLFVAGRRR